MKKQLLAIVLGASAFVSTAAMAADIPFPHLETTGRGEVTVKPDMAVFSVNVVETKKTAVDAKLAVDQAVTKFIERLQAAGVNKKDINSANISLSARYAYPKDQKPELAGFKASRNIEVTVHQLTKLNTYLDDALGDGMHQINNIDLKELKKKLLKDVRIENINIEKKNINKIKIDVEERKSEFYVQYKDKLYTMSKDGVIFGRIDEYPKQSMPILNLKDSKNKDRLILILEKIKDLDFLDEISQIYVINKNLVCLVLVDGTRIKTNINVTRDKYKIVMNLYNELKKNEKIEYIDARFKDIFIKEEEGNNAR